MVEQPNVLEQVLAQRQSVADRLARIRHVTPIMSGKGGVGKSALTANLAAELARRGRAVGALDADLHGASLATMLGAQGQTIAIETAGARPAVGVADVRVMGIDLFVEDNAPIEWRHPGGLAADTHVWRGSLEANALREMVADTNWRALDYLLIDMPPGADRFETLHRIVPQVAGALVVTIPSQVARRVVRRAITAARAAGANLLGLVENMAGIAVDGTSTELPLFPDGNGSQFAQEVDIPYLGTIPFDSRLAATTDAGRPFVLEHAQTVAGRAIVALADKFEAALA